MKNLIIILSMLCAGCASTAPRHYATTTEARATIAAYDTKAVEWFFTDHMRYWRDYDERDDFRPTTETLAKGFGDCDDFARVALEMVRLWPGCESKITVYETGHNTNNAHAVTETRCENGLSGAWDNGSWVKNWTCPGRAYTRPEWANI